MSSKIMLIVQVVAVVTTLTTSLEGADFSASQRSRLYHGPLETQFARIEAEVPGFGGWYFNENGEAVLRVKDLKHGPQAIERVGIILDARPRAGRAVTPRERPFIKVQPANFSFSELAIFRDIFSQNLIEGIHSIDADEENNVLSIGVRDQEVAHQVRATAARLHIPGNALHVKIESAPSSRAALADYHRPLRGGMGFSFIDGITKYCSIGINGYWQYGVHGFVTASHCTSSTWNLTGNVAYQPSPSTDVATESFDPPAWTGTAPWGGVCPSGPGYPAGLHCRSSDAAFYTYDSTSLHGGTTIAETATWASGRAAPNNEVVGFMDVGGSYEPAVGDYLDKMGADSGWTWGKVLETCLLLPHDKLTPTGKPVWLFCQGKAEIYSRAGDSGSPVFKWYSTHVDFVGILWGGPSSPTQSYYSPAFNVYWDLSGLY